MPILKIINKKVFYKLLKIFKGQTTFSITESVMEISGLCMPFYHMAIPHGIYEIDIPVEFTIDINNILEYLVDYNSEYIIIINNVNDISRDNIMVHSIYENNTFNNKNDEVVSNSANNSNTKSSNNLTHAINSFKIIYNSKYGPENTYDTIDIPLSTPINSLYRQPNSFTTRVMINKNDLKYFPTGIVKYSTDNGKLIIHSSSTDMEEKVIMEPEFLLEGYLEFWISNEWISRLEVGQLCNDIHNILLCFSDGLLCIKMIFNKCKGAMLEIQVEEKIM